MDLPMHHVGVSMSFLRLNLDCTDVIHPLLQTLQILISNLDHGSIGYLRALRKYRIGESVIHSYQGLYDRQALSRRPHARPKCDSLWAMT